MNINEKFLIYGAGSFLTILAIIYFELVGYPLINTAIETIPIKTPSLYMIPIFFVYGMILGEILWLWIAQDRRIKSYILLIESIILGLFSFTRYILVIPFSGHAIIISFYLVHYIFTIKKEFILRIIIGIIVLCITMFFKIILWLDPITFTLGVIMGILISLIEIIYTIKKREEWLI